MNSRLTPHFLFVFSGSSARLAVVQQALLKSSLLRQSLAMAMSFALLITLAACSSVGSREEAVLGEDIALLAHAQRANVAADTTVEDPQATLMYQLLAGEFAGVRGDMDQAVSFYSEAALKSEHPQVINRAAYIALYAGQDQLAADLTDRWQALGFGSYHSIERIRILAYLHLQQIEPVMASVEQLLMIDEKVNESAVASLTHILTKETTPHFALEIAQRLNQKYSDTPLLMLLLAKFEANLKQYDLALAHVNQLIEIDDNILDAYLVKAQVLAGLGDQKGSTQAIAVVVGKRPDDTRMRLQYARMLVQFKEFDEALKHFQILKDKMPDNENVLLSLGLLSIEINQQKQAKEYLQALLDEGYHNQQAHYYLGRIQQNQGEVMPAITNYLRVVDGEYWLDARIRAAGLLASSGQTDQALLQLESLVEHQGQTESNRIKLYLAKGEVLAVAQREKEAFNLYNDALSQSPENTELLYARALIAEKLNLLDVAESDLKLVIMHEPQNASALNALGYTLADRTQRYREAREYIMKAAQLLPDDPAILDSLGWVHYRLGEYENAIKWLSKAFDTLQDAEIAAHLGEVLWVSGQTAQAETIWQKGAQLDGNQAVLRDTIQRFK